MVLFGKKYRKLSDNEIILKYRETSNNRYFGILFDRYYALVFGVCLKYLKDKDDSKDALSKVFEAVMQQVLSDEVHNFSSWLHSVTRNQCLMIIRARTREQHRLKNYQAEFAADGDFDDQTFLYEKEEIIVQMEHKLEELAPEQKLCLRLFFLEDKSYREIAEASGFDEKQVKSYIQNGKRNLKIKLEKPQARQNKTA